MLNKKILNSKLSNIIVVVFFGWFGAHYFIRKNFKMGFIYLFTVGLFAFGWIFDIYRVIVNKEYEFGAINKKSIMTKEFLNMIKEGKLPKIDAENINLLNDEICVFIENAYTTKSKTRVAGYTGNKGGLSIRITKGLFFRTGSSNSRAIRETVTEEFQGILYLTTKRLIYTSKDQSFDSNLNKITSISQRNGGIIVQINTKLYDINFDNSKVFMKALNIIKNNL